MRIDALEAVVASTRNDATRAEPIAAWSVSGGAPENPDGDDYVDDGARTAARAPRGDFAPRRTASSSRSTPDRVVSDDSGEAAADDDSSSCLLLGLSRISLARSWDGDSRDAADDGDVEPADGRWNIPQVSSPAQPQCPITAGLVSRN